jgi:hypothetical protein
LEILLSARETSATEDTKKAFTVFFGKELTMVLKSMGI